MLVSQARYRVAAVCQTIASTVSHASAPEQLPASPRHITCGPSIQYLVQDVIKSQPLIHFFHHRLWLCNCRNMDEIAKLNHVSFPLIHYENSFGDFDRLGPEEQAFVVHKTLQSGGEASSCVVMQHVYTKRSRKLYVFKTITKDKSLVTHPEHGIISNEASILLGELKTNLYPHPNIIQLFNCVTSNAIAGIPIHILQMEHCDGGDLWDFNIRCIKHGVRLPRSFIAHIFASLSAALAYLHHGLVLTPSGSLERKYLPGSQNHWRPILHNDIKPENIFLRWPLHPSSASKFPEIVLSDFGVAGMESHIKGPRGTYRYAALEVREAFDLPSSLLHRLKSAATRRGDSNVILTTKSDVWSLGAVMEFLFFEFERERGGKEWVEKGKMLQWVEVEVVYGEVMVKWVRRCFGYRALGRPSARTLLGTAVVEVGRDEELEEEVQRFPG